jgi:germination protein M
MHQAGKLKKFIMTVLLFLLCLMCTSCSRQNSTAQKDTHAVQVYYVNNDETAVVSEKYELTSDPKDADAVIRELLEQMEKIPEKLEYEAPISGNVRLEKYALKDDILTLSFDAGYNNLDHTTEILDRAAMVRTLTQVTGVKYVSFLVGGEALTDESGKVVGNMSSDMFIYNAGNEINSYEKVQLTLYFTNQTGDGLIPVYRTVVYNSNISMERLVMEQLISGPNTNAAYPTLNPDTGVVSVTLRDGICYVDLDEKFEKDPYKVTAETAIYSIVNSLTDLVDVNKVQISVNGKTNIKFMDTMNLSNTYERNLEIIDKEQ